MEVIVGIGTDKVRFGITEAEAVSVLGAPDKTYTTDEGCKRLQFNLLRIELSFEPENENRLGWIEVHDPKLLLSDRKLVGLAQQEVLSFVTELLDEQPEIEDYDSFLSVSYDEHWVELQFQFGCLICVNFGVLYDESENPKWPSS